ncbi:MAG: hypothetical protein R3B91_11345 [Planctomycetaceae bacterium]
MKEEKSILVPILIGCGLFGLLCFLVCGGGLFFFVPRAMQQMNDVMQQVTQEMARQQMFEAFPGGWRAPEPAVSDEELFHEAIGNFTLLEHDTSASPADFGLADREGRHAIYETALTKVEVYAYLADDAEQEELSQAFQESLETNFSNHVTSTISQANYRSTYFSVSPPNTTGWLWSSEGWMFLILSDDQLAATTFLTEYLLTIQSPVLDEPETAEETDAAKPAEPSSDAEDVEETPATPTTEQGDFPPPPPRPEAVQSIETR